jgi:hypothetical protein
MSVLNRIDIFDSKNALYNFPTQEDYWISLARVSVEADSYLRDFTAPVILCDEDTRNLFLKELKLTRELLASLCVNDAVHVLDQLADAVARNDSATLIDELRVFYADMKILKNTVNSAMIPTG